MERRLQQGDVAGAVRLGWAGDEQELEMAMGRAPACFKRRPGSAVSHVHVPCRVCRLSGSRSLAGAGRLGRAAKEPVWAALPS